MPTGATSLLRRTKAHPIETLEAIDAELAHASLSLDAGEPPDLVGGRAAIGVDALLARIEDAPKRSVRTDYVDAWTRYGDRVVSADYSFNWVPSRSLFALMTTDDGTPIVHYSIEIDPEHFGLETDDEQSRYYTTLDVNVEVTDTNDTLVHSTSRSTTIELTPEQVEAVQTAPVAYQDDFPLVPGRYTVRVYVQNRALQNWTVAEAELSAAEASITDIILCYDVTELGGDVDAHDVRTFQLGATRLAPATGSIFASGESVKVFAQVPAGARTRFELIADGDVHDEHTGGLVGELSTFGLDGGSYEVRATVIDEAGSTIAEKSTTLTLSPRSYVARPGFVYRRGFNTRVRGLLALVRGDQLWRLGRFGRRSSAI